MTDKDIIKALHTACLLDPKNIFIRNYITGEITTLNMDDVLNLINRQQAEIEELKLINSTYDVKTAHIRETAIKEFALSLINKSNDEKISRTDIVDFIIEFLKEEEENK